ncbi:hypothetical protein CHELA40_10240 [Chelatococcus asaccharovorans]|nr:hypothetical protein CHELA40_10240 [Chelatococcus asaccharovorans]CAH1686966.1 hypothetical protein CHELA17_65369 [Chelatococcus asaccharovorans]
MASTRMRYKEGVGSLSIASFGTAQEKLCWHAGLRGIIGSARGTGAFDPPVQVLLCAAPRISQAMMDRAQMLRPGPFRLPIIFALKIRMLIVRRCAAQPVMPRPCPLTRHRTHGP